MSGPRPIHSKPREINEQPSPNEPSSSYGEDSPYLNDASMIAAEQFHSKRREYFSFSPHPSNIGSGAAAAASAATATAAYGGRAGCAKTCSRRTRPSSMAAAHPASPRPTAANQRKLQIPRKAAPVAAAAAAVEDSTRPSSDWRALQPSQSLNEIFMLDESDLHVNLPRAPGSYPSLVPLPSGLMGRGESLASTLSSHTNDSVSGSASSAGPIDVGGDGVLRLPRTPDFVWENNCEASLSSSAEFSPQSHTAAKAQHQYVRKESAANIMRRADAKREAKKEAKKRTNARMYKHDALEGSLEFGHETVSIASDFSCSDMPSSGASIEEISDDSFSKMLQGKRLDILKHNLSCALESPGKKKKLALRDLNLTCRELPVDVICSYPLGSDLLKLCLSGNQLNYVPPRLVMDLTGLRTLDLQQCCLSSLPEHWDLPNLSKLDLSHNRLKSFLTQDAINGLPLLEHLDLSNNEICVWTLPAEEFLTQLEHLNLEYNEIIELPAELTRLHGLRSLNISNNQVTHIPEQVCKMHLAELLVLPNPLIQPPSEECEHGIDGMRRYYVGLAKLRNFKASAARRREFRLRGKERRKSRKETDSSKVSSTDIENEDATIREDFEDMTEETSTVVCSPCCAAAQSTGDRTARSSANAPASSVGPDMSLMDEEHEEVNDTLKMIVVGMGCTGKTTLIKRLKDGIEAEIPNHEERTIGVDINEWDPSADRKTSSSNDFDYDTSILQEGKRASERQTDIKFCVWDFAGQDVYHATHEIFFSQNSLYVLLWDMAAHNKDVKRRPKVADIDDGWDDSSDEDYDEIYTERELLRAERALDKDIDDKVQYWVNCIQSRVPGAAILPVASFDDIFDVAENGGPEEARRRVNRMKERLIHHEKRRVDGMNERLSSLKTSNRANSQEASRIRELLSPFHRPKLIFGDEGDLDTVPRVSGKDSRGFNQLRRKIISIATGRHLPSGMKYPLFRGHVGSPIPPIRTKIRDFIRWRKAEKKYQVIEMRCFIGLLNDFLGFEVDHGQIGDALRFLSRIGELSFFGDSQIHLQPFHPIMRNIRDNHTNKDSSDDENDTIYLSDNKCVQVHKFDDRRNDDAPYIKDEWSGLGQFVFLDPKWLAATLGCILRHDLKQQIEETRYELERDVHPSSRWQLVGRGDSFHDANKNCPVITASECSMLWKARKKIRKAAERSLCNRSDSNKACPFVFMQGLLVHFSVFVPIDLNIDKAILGGHDFSIANDIECLNEKERSFFLPSQLSLWDPADKIWTYKSNDSWKTCLCHSWLFPDGSPPGLFEHVTAAVLRDLYAITSDDEAKTTLVTIPDTDEQIGKLYFREVLCWKTAFNLVLGKPFVADDGDLKESRVEIWAHLIDQESQFCVAGESTAVGTRRLVVSGKGLEGNGCRKIWDGGYGLVLKAVECVVAEYGGLEYVKQAVCPQCLATRNLRFAKVWDWTCVQGAVKRGPGTITCDNGHRVDVRHVGGRVRLPCTFSEDIDTIDPNLRVPFSDLCNGVVLVGLWDGDENRIVAAGSGFIVDSKRGLVVTAGHILIDMANGDSFGSEFFGLQRGRAAIGIIPAKNKICKKNTGPKAIFRYFAEIVAKNPRNMDACVLRINAKIRAGVIGDGCDCGRYVSEPLLHRDDLARENFLKLRPTRLCEYEEEVRILGFNQGGEGLVDSPRLNRVIEVVKGNIVKIHDARDLYFKKQIDQKSFRPFMEIVVGNCPTIGGQSGGPCVNQSGKVIGILSRADPEDKSRCYLVPAKEFMELVNVAKSWDDYQNVAAG